MQAVTEEKLDTQILKISSPVLSQMAWQIESFLLRIFEYGDYSFRKVLTGCLSSNLQCTFFIAQNKCNILAAAGSLYLMDNPAVAILGPVCVDPQYRRKGLANRVCEFSLKHLKAQSVKAVYLGVKQDNPAVGLYRKLDFENYSGIVMRKLFVSKDEFNERHLPGQTVIIRKMGWQDFTEISALLCEPAEMYSFDFCRGVFSTRYIEAEKFLPVFPQMMKDIEKNGGYANILQEKERSSIVGAAHINVQISKAQSHIAVLDFFILDDFLNKAEGLVCDAIKQFSHSGNRMILCYCLDRDIEKKQILKSIGAKPYAALHGFVKINDKLQDVIIFRL